MNEEQKLEEYFKVLEIPEKVFKHIWKKIKDDKSSVDIFYTVFGLVVHHKKHNEKTISWKAPMPSPNYYSKYQFTDLCDGLNIKNDISDMIWNIIKQDGIMCSIFISVFGIAYCEILIERKADINNKKCKMCDSNNWDYKKGNYICKNCGHTEICEESEF